MSARGGPGITRTYEALVYFHLAALLYVFPYGVALNATTSIRIADLVGLLCLFCGAIALAVRPRVRLDGLFLAVVGPYLLLEIAAPLIGAVGYGKLADGVSSLRVAVLWFPMLMLALIAAPGAEARFERRLRGLLAVTVWLNIAYAIVQLAAFVGFVPSSFMFTAYLEPWAVDPNFEPVTALRPAGFFFNTTALSVFAIVSVCFFYARYVARRGSTDLLHTVGAAFLAALTTSRTAVVAVGVILAMGWLVLEGRRKFALFAIVAVVVVGFLLFVEYTVGLERAFYRFTRVVESGLLEDYSLGKRINETWPAALEVARDYPIGTWIYAPRVAELIDSGYLNYFIQGRFVSLGVVMYMLAGLLLVGSLSLRRPTRLQGGMLILFLALFLVPAMVVTNPIRSPIIAALIVYGFWKLGIERRLRRFRLDPIAAGAPGCGSAARTGRGSRCAPISG